ncbi:hypothetical protein [Burkholderia multivorans]|nr:hypothetical protein [Burkholderia multivorans]MDR9051740.1 hypothetical protein [Burkholderia multivorans]MDR9057722.1 hypothetical protein [Burkholderia multivorans]MDR9064633.1 hypothetical protein [Burkholderia multivorans]MDR9069756.1 hypothetical protein [Burkholderia multivorans]MDR9076836.1 hypothetical protein [Burkholderia multivorans]
MSRFTDHAALFERRHPRAARALVVAILVAVALLAVAVDSTLRAFVLQ